MNFCQSCGMPMEANDAYGDNADGSKSTDYCSYCYGNGEFLQDVSMQEMIDFCIPHVVEAKVVQSEDEAKKMMQEFFPKLKRWMKK